MNILKRILGPGLLLMFVVMLAFPADSTTPTKNRTAAASISSRVKLNVTVTDSSNRPVTDVSPEDFQVFENDVQQTITSVTQQNGPLSYGLVVDCSGSLRTQVSNIIKAGEAVISTMKSDDEAFVIRFISREKITLIQDWTASRAKLNGTLNDMFPEGGQSAIVDAVYKAANYVAARKKLDTNPHRHSLVLITDGEDRENFYNLKDLIKLVRDTDLQIFVIGLVDQIDGKKPQEKALDLMNTLANETGGRVFLIDGKLEPSESGSSPGSTDRAFLSDRKLELQQIAAELTLEREARYLISYNSTNSSQGSSFRKVRVVIKAKDGQDKRKAMTRPGYTVPGS